MNIKFNGKKFLITGGAGFIGSHMCEKLLNLGAKVVCFDNLSSGNMDNISDFKKRENFFFVKGDANQRSDLKNVFRRFKVDYVIHYAAVVGVKMTLENPLNVLRDIDGIKNILELSRINKIKKFIFSSSSEIYGKSREMPLNEDNSSLNARLPYAAVKLVGENYCKSYYELYGLPAVSLRFFNVYGPRQESSNYGFVTAIFIKQALSNKPLTIFGDGSQTRDFIFIDDNIQATLKALMEPKAIGQAINIGAGAETTVLDLAKKIIKLSGKKLKFKFLKPRTEGDMPRRYADIKKMKTLLGYKPVFNLEKGLGRILQFNRQNS